MPTNATGAGPAKSSAPPFTPRRNTAATTRQDPVFRVIRHPLKDVYVPVYAGEYTAAECAGRDKYIIDGKEYEECAFCRASCPSRSEFKEPDSGLPLKCDMCEGEEEPLCVKWCLVDALTYEEREEEVEEEESPEDMEIGLQALANQYGLDKIMETVARMSIAKRA